MSGVIIEPFLVNWKDDSGVKVVDGQATSMFSIFCYKTIGSYISCEFIGI